MARKPRIHYPGASLHVIVRGNAGQIIFFADKYRQYYYHLLKEGVGRYNHRIHAFCLMPNHVHLVIQIGEIPIWRIMQDLNQKYAFWANRQKGRTGHIFQGRYKSVLLEAESHLLEVVRYIHLNPVRAGLVRFAEDHPWCSHRAYMGMETLPWLTPDFILGMFSAHLGTAREKYKNFVSEGVNEEQLATIHGTVEVEKNFNKSARLNETMLLVERSAGREASLDEIIERVCSLCGLAEHEIVAAGKRRGPSGARRMISWLVREADHLSLTALSKRLNRDISSLSGAATYIEGLTRADKTLAEKLARLKKELL